MLKTELGRLAVQQPVKHGTAFRSTLAKCLGRLGCRLLPSLDEVVSARPVETRSRRDIEATLVDAMGKPLVSRSVVSRWSDTLYQEYEASTKCDLSELDVVYVFVDDLYTQQGKNYISYRLAA